MKYVFVGTGIAALSAAEAVRRRDPHAELIMLGREPHPFYSRPGLAYLLTGSIPERQLHLRSADELSQLGLDRRVAEVTAIDVARREVHVAGAAPIGYDRLLLAVGAAAIPPDFPGGDLDGVVQLDQLDQTRDIIARADKARAAVVVGGGPTALELAEGLAARDVEVHYFLRGARYWSSVLDAEESRRVENAVSEQGIILHHQTKVARAVGDDRGTLDWVETEAGDTVSCQLLAVAIGVRPRLELARAAGLAVGRGIRVDERFETSVPGVFAAGDCAEVADPVTGRGAVDSLWSTALAAGAIAGTAMAGAPAGYRRPPSLNVTRLGHITTTIIGAVGGRDGDGDLLTISRGDSLSWRVQPSAWSLTGDDPGRRIRVMVGPDTLLGAVVMNDPAAARALTRLVRQRTPLGPLRDALEADPGSALTKLIALGGDGGAASS